MLRKNGRIVDQQQRARRARARLLLAAEPVLEGERQEVADVDDLGRLALDDGGAEHAGIVAADLDVEPVLDDVDDLVDHQRHRAGAVGEHQQRLGALALHAHALVHADQRHQLAAVLHHVAAVRQFDLAGVDFLEPRDQRQRHRLGLRRSRRGTPAATSSARRPRRGWLSAASSASICEVTALPSDCAMPFGSMIMITEPSPRMVLPENIAMWRSLLDIGFTTISSVWNTPSTTMPKVWLPTCVTTMKPLSTSPALGFGAEQLAQARQRQQLVAQAQHRGVLDALDAVLAAGARAHQFDHGELRDGEAVAAGLDDQRRDDRERERNLDGEAQARRRRPTSRRWCRRSGRYCCAPRPCRRRGRTRW